MAARHPSPRRHTGRAAPLLALLLFAACATQKPPDGGPPDTEPPTVLETEPPNGSTRFTGDRVRITFDEYVNRQSFQQALHIAPFMQTPPEISWSGRSVDIRFTEPLKENRTYVVTVGTALKDANGGNALAASTTLAFATGDSIDRGSFFGKVSDDKPAGVSLFAFALPDGRADTLNPSRVRPDYAAQCGQDGSFRFSNVAIRRYRVFAVRDRQADFFYDIETDDFGAPWGDIDLGVADSLQEPQYFRLATEDTTAPYMQSVEAQNAALLRVKFSEEPVGVTAPQFTVTDSVSGAPHAVVAVLPSARGKYAWDVFLAPPLGRGRYLLRVDSLRDRAGHEIPEALRSVAFDGVDAADTVKPSLLSVSPAARATDVPLDSVFEIRFSHPMRAQVGATLRDSLRNALPLEASWASLTALRLAHPPLAPEAAYTLCIELASLRDSLRGMAVADTAFCVGFTTEKASSAGSISGALTDRRGTALPKIVRAKNVEKKHLPVQTRAAADGAFSFPGLPAGKYMLDAWEDADSSGAWSPGKPFPFAPSERFAAAPDTVRVRARWETSGTRITLP